MASSDRLARAVRACRKRRGRRWSRTCRAARMPASDIPWIRAREMWIHAVDLDAGVSSPTCRPDARRAAHRRLRDVGPQGIPAAASSRRRSRLGDRGGDGGGGHRPGGRAGRMAAGPLQGAQAAARRRARSCRRCRHGSNRRLGRFPDFAAVRAEFALPTGFPAAVLAEAAGRPRARRGAGRAGIDATDMALVTIDPPGARDLDQAVRHDPAAGRVPGALRDRRRRRVRRAGRRARRRGAPPRPDRLLPRRLGAAAPALLSEGAASLLPGRAPAGRAVDDRPGRRRRARRRRRAAGPGAQPGPAGLRGRCRPRSTPGRPHPAVAALPELGRAAPGAGRATAARSSWAARPGGRARRRRAAGRSRSARRPPVEGWNAEISLLTGRCAARLMLDAGVGVLRTLPAARARRRRAAAADGARRLGRRLARRGRRGEVLAGLPRAPPPALALPGRPARCCGARATPRSTAAGRHRPRTRARRRRRAVRARHRAAAAAGRPVRHARSASRWPPGGAFRVAARRAARPARR